MHIDVRIPYDENRDLGAAYNRAMEVAEDWVLFLDHDAFLLNPNWYSICNDAIKEVGHDAGLITCYTNRIGNPNQKILPFLANKFQDNIVEHTNYSKSIYATYGSALTDITEITKTWKISGFFILTHKKAWLDAGKFTNGFLGVDNIYGDSLINAGYKIYRLEGLYVYHRYWRDWSIPKCI